MTTTIAHRAHEHFADFRALFARRAGHRDCARVRVDVEYIAINAGRVLVGHRAAGARVRRTHPTRENQLARLSHLK